MPLLERCRVAEDEYIAARAEALLRGAAWFRQDEAACVEGFEALRARLERLGDRETLAWFWFEQGALRHPLGEHAEAAALLRRAIAWRRRSASRPPTAPRAATSRCSTWPRAGRRTARAELLAIHAHTLLHGGSFALPWISLLVGVADAACGDLKAAARRGSRTLVELQAWGAAHALAWATRGAGRGPAAARRPRDGADRRARRSNERAPSATPGSKPRPSTGVRPSTSKRRCEPKELLRV